MCLYIYIYIYLSMGRRWYRTEHGLITFSGSKTLNNALDSRTKSLYVLGVNFKLKIETEKQSTPSKARTVTVSLFLFTQIELIQDSFQIPVSCVSV